MPLDMLHSWTSVSTEAWATHCQVRRFQRRGCSLPWLHVWYGHYLYWNEEYIMIRTRMSKTLQGHAEHQVQISIVGTDARCETWVSLSGTHRTNHTRVCLYLALAPWNRPLRSRCSAIMLRTWLCALLQYSKKLYCINPVQLDTSTRTWPSWQWSENAPLQALRTFTELLPKVCWRRRSRLGVEFKRHRGLDLSRKARYLPIEILREVISPAYLSDIECNSYANK